MDSETNKNGNQQLDWNVLANLPEDERQFQEELAADPWPLGQILLAARREYLANGGKLMTLDEINAEVAARRAGVIS